MTLWCGCEDIERKTKTSRYWTRRDNKLGHILDEGNPGWLVLVRLVQMHMLLENDIGKVMKAMYDSVAIIARTVFIPFFMIAAGIKIVIVGISNKINMYSY